MEPLVTPYLGKWICLTGALRNVYEPSGRWDDELKISKPTMMVVISGKSNEEIYLYFDASWLDRLHMLPLGQIIKVRGRIAKIHQYEIQLESCELIDEASVTSGKLEVDRVSAPKQRR